MKGVLKDNLGFIILAVCGALVTLLLFIASHDDHNEYEVLKQEFGETVSIIDKTIISNDSILKSKSKKRYLITVSNEASSDDLKGYHVEFNESNKITHKESVDDNDLLALIQTNTY